jgi:FO synthase
MSNHEAILKRAAAGHSLSAAEALSLAGCGDLDGLMAAAAKSRDAAHGDRITYSPKVFIPLTQLCRDACRYCTFAKAPHKSTPAYLSPAQVLEIARAGAIAGCHEALFTLGDRPEQRYRVAAEELRAQGYETTLSYLEEMAALVARETGLLVHLNPGLMSAAEIARLRRVSVSQGIMLESAAERLCLRGGPHFGAASKAPALRLATIAAAGAANVPFTSGILIGIGETLTERIEALLALRDLHGRYGHLQEIIVQNFRAKSGTRMAAAPEPSFAEHLWTIAVARLIFGSEMSIQAPPNLAMGALPRLIAAGINDWGGISPVTPDHVNPESPWPAAKTLTAQTAKAGKVLVPRLAIYPSYIAERARWLDPGQQRRVLQVADSEGLAREGRWVPGSTAPADLIFRGPAQIHVRTTARRSLEAIIARAESGESLSEEHIVALFAARGEDFDRVCQAADALRRRVSGKTVGYVVNRNINYTNICNFRCQFCAFSKGKLSENLRGQPYDLAMEEIDRRTREAWSRGATEVCLQGGIHPNYDGETYLRILRTVKQACPSIHVHAFSPLEIWQGAESLGLSVTAFLERLQDAGLGSLPGTAAEILDDEVRRVICPDKVTTQQWLNVVQAAHMIGLPTTSTMMFGHVDEPRHWARHLLRLRDLQARTGGITEFVPLPFVPMETPIYLKGQSRRGPTLREAVLVHAVARLALHPLVTNIQTSWVKMGVEGLRLALESGANDLGGTLMNESISRAAGAEHGQEMAPEIMEAAILALSRQPRQRTTLYAEAPAAQRATSFAAIALAAPVLTLPKRRAKQVLDEAASL